ncbi:MAG: SCP-like extracellular [Chloroflexi bacterium OLB14]|nr:MAG: SCP-like extracellular [Chloroflexi bacterium OLB14]
MYKKIFLLSILFLSSCISIGVDAPQTPTPAGFVTATLIPTKAGFVPATLTPTFESTVAPTLAVTQNANCKDSAILLRDVTIPDDTNIKAGEKFTKTWEFQNVGDCNWVGYTIQFDSGDEMSAPQSAPVPDTAPKGIVQVSVNLTAPTVDGTYQGNFTLHNTNGNSIFIGTEKTFWVKIVVGNLNPQTPSASTTKTPYVPSGGNSNCSYTQNASYVSQIISLINQARVTAKLSTLTVNAQLTSAAQNHSIDMACNNFLNHTGSDGSTIGNRLADAGFTSLNYLEIIAIGTPQNAIDQWRADAGHWEAVLNPSMKYIGVGYAYYADSNFGGYITVTMGGN